MLIDNRLYRSCVDVVADVDPLFGVGNMITRCFSVSGSSTFPPEVFLRCGSKMWLCMWFLFFSVLRTQAGNATPGPATNNNADYEDVSTVIPFTASQETAYQDITIHNDNNHEPDERFTVYIDRHGQATYIDPAANMCEVIILDDDCKLFSWKERVFHGH